MSINILEVQGVGYFMRLRYNYANLFKFNRWCGESSSHPRSLLVPVNLWSSLKKLKFKIMYFLNLKWNLDWLPIPRWYSVRQFSNKTPRLYDVINQHQHDVISSPGQVHVRPVLQQVPTCSSQLQPTRRARWVLRSWYPLGTILVARVLTAVLASYSYQCQ